MNSFGSRANLRLGQREFEIFRIDNLDRRGISTSHLPYSLRILLENLLRNENGKSVRQEDILALAGWKADAPPSQEIAFMPSH